ncbi:MAG TPA: DNA-deoxyinosine glycosylase [Steroidobacteraceae bacterium]
MSTLSFGFPPISTPAAEILVLGSLPGRKSLDRSQYYAHPQNTFWKIMAAHVGAAPDDYARRVRLLAERKVALWDVLAAATRSGSLDADIGEDAIPNNFRAFFHGHAEIRLICFNGGTAAKLYRKHVLGTLSEPQRAIELRILPSTSPAHASITLAQKIALWAAVWGAA